MMISTDNFDVSTFCPPVIYTKICIHPMGGYIIVVNNEGVYVANVEKYASINVG